MGVVSGLYMCDVVKKFTFVISSPDEFLSIPGLMKNSPGIFMLFTFSGEMLQNPPYPSPYV